MKTKTSSKNPSAPNVADAAPASAENVAAANAATSATPTATPDPAMQISALENQVQDLTADLQRTRADFENFRKQVDLQREQAKQAAVAATVEKFLPLVDNLERALTTYAEQLGPLAKSFDQTLQSLGLAVIDSTPDTEFNPDLHEAVTVEGDGAREVVAETLRPGYTYQGSVLRAAMVKVKKVD